MAKPVNEFLIQLINECPELSTKQLAQIVGLSRQAVAECEQRYRTTPKSDNRETVGVDDGLCEIAAKVLEGMTDAERTAYLTKIRTDLKL